MKIALVRGAFLAQYEAQLYYPLAKRHTFVAFSSLHPFQDQYPFPLKKLISPTDIPFGLFKRFKMPILNRLFIDAHLLLGLESNLKGFDIAHCADTFYHFTHQCIKAKKKGYVKKVIATVFENIPFNNEGIIGRKSFKSNAIANVDHFIAVSERSKAALILEGCDERKITVITQHIDSRRFKPKNIVKLNPKEISILFAGRLEFYKGIYEVVYSAKRLLSDADLSKFKINFLIAGEGTEKENVRKLVHKLNIQNNITFISVPYNNMHDVYHAADIFVAPSRATRTYQEQFSTVLLEAQSSGLPIVTTLSGGIPENVEYAAMLSNPEDFYSISNNLKKFILNKKLRTIFGRKARKHVVEKFDIREGSKKVEEVYEKTFSQKN